MALKTVHKHKIAKTVMCEIKVHNNKTRLSSFWEQVTCKKCLGYRPDGHTV